MNRKRRKVRENGRTHQEQMYSSNPLSNFSSLSILNVDGMNGFWKNVSLHGWTICIRMHLERTSSCFFLVLSSFFLFSFFFPLIFSLTWEYLSNGEMKRKHVSNITAFILLLILMSTTKHSSDTFWSLWPQCIFTSSCPIENVIVLIHHISSWSSFNFPSLSLSLSLSLISLSLSLFLLFVPWILCPTFSSSQPDKNHSMSKNEANREREREVERERSRERFHFLRFLLPVRLSTKSKMLLTMIYIFLISNSLWSQFGGGEIE